MGAVLLKDMTEKVLLVQQTRDLKNLCKSFDELKAENREEHKDLTKEIRVVSEGKVSNLHLWSKKLKLDVKPVIGPVSR